MATTWRFVVAMAMECAWEMIENSNAVIQHYRQATAALGYNGDTVLNSLGDIFCCGIGFVLAVKLGWRWSVALFVAVEVMLTFWIRDSLLLEILMLVHPIEAVKNWQMAH
jgi:predicted MFS family arabinose efflux permease